MQKKKILFFEWNAFMQKGIENAFKRAGVSYDTFYYIFKDWDHDDEFIAAFEKKLEGSGYDIVFSVNFSPLISDVCNEKNIKYISWVYDAPINIRRTDSLKNACNEIYFFDRIQAETYAIQGVKGAHHLPLAVDTQVFSAEYINTHKSETKQSEFGKACDNFNGSINGISSEDACDVSLVGQLYKSDFAYLCGPLDG